jgi:hypothetical protein
LLGRARIARRAIQRVSKGKRRGCGTDPQANANWRFPQVLTLFRRALSLTTEQLAGANHCSCALELLDGEQTQGVTHQYCDARTIVAFCAAKSSKQDYESR